MTHFPFSSLVHIENRDKLLFIVENLKGISHYILSVCLQYAITKSFVTVVR